MDFGYRTKVAFLGIAGSTLVLTGTLRIIREHKAAKVAKKPANVTVRVVAIPATPTVTAVEPIKTPPPVPQVVSKKVTVTKKVVTRAKRKVAKAVVKPAAQPPKEFALDEAPTEETEEAVNVFEPLLELATNELTNVVSDAANNPFFYAVNLSPATRETMDASIREIVPVLVEDQFEDMRKELRQHKENIAYLNAFEPPESADDFSDEDFPPVAEKEVNTPPTVAVVEPPVENVAKAVVEPPPTQSEAAPIREEKETREEVVREEVAETLKSNDDDEEATPEPELVRQEPAKEAPKESLVAQLSPVDTHVPANVAIPTPPKLTTQVQSPAPKVAVPVPTTQPRIRVAAQQRPAEDPISDEPIEGVLYGDLDMDDSVHKWLADTKGHVELYLRPVQKTLDVNQDTIFLDYEYPDSEFEEAVTERLKGSYHLVAGIFTADDKSPRAVAEVIYPNIISARTYKERIYFKINEVQLRGAMKRNRDVSTNVELSSVSLSIFEGGVGNYRSPNRVKNAVVKLVGFPERKPYLADAEGTVRIPGIPPSSELSIEVSAPNFYPAHYVVPVGRGAAYQQIYLLSKGLVDVVTTNFLKTPESPELGVVMGRVFDTETRQPKKDEMVRLAMGSSLEKGVYFNAFPDATLPATTEMGLFGFFNVTPTVRRVLRPGGRTFEVPLLPGFAQFVELGRGGKRNVRGAFVDPFEDRAIEGRVRIAGDAKSEMDIGENSQFEIPGVDFPPGILTLESNVEGYPLTWHVTPWNPIEPQRQKNLYLIRKDLIDDAISRTAGTKWESDKGVVVGGAEPEFFKRGTCVQVELADENGNPVSKSAGPYPFSGTKMDRAPEGAPFCLTAQKPGFAFYNLLPGQYTLRWKTPDNALLRTHVIRSGANRLTVSVN